jgi:hypothetical protein
MPEEPAFHAARLGGVAPLPKKHIRGRGHRAAMSKREGPTDQEIFSFPDLVFKELLAALCALAVLVLWSVLVDAPLKGIADPNWTENPAKAPWYFVGLQELLVYFDPWIAGVMVPLFIIVGLAALPYLDTNPQGKGYYSIRPRKLVVPMFLFGYVLWFGLIVVGQFLRGPNWQFYWPWEDWSIPKSAERALVNLPVHWGALAVLAYFGLGLLLPAIIWRKMWRSMGAIRYVAAWSLALFMWAVVIKIALRLAFHVKYILVTPYFNI